MPGASETVNLIGRDGSVVPVAVDQVAGALASGFSLESADQAAQRLAGEAREEQYGGLIGEGAALAAGGARGLTFGASDVLIGGLGGQETLRGLRDVNQTASTIGEIGGSLVGAFAAPGSLIARTPAGMAARAGARIAGLGEEAGAIGRAAYAAGGAALEGAAQNAGAYVSDVALGDRELSADGFMGAMGKGALWGGVAGGALSFASDGLVAARRLFPKQEITREAVQTAESAATKEIASAVDDSHGLELAARTRLRELREQRAAVDLDTKVKLDEIALRKAEEIAAAETRAAQAKASTAEAKLERVKNPPARKTRKAFDEPAEAIAEAAPQAEAVAAGVTEDTTTALERQLAAMKSGIDSGKSIQDLAAERSITNKATHIEDALNAEMAKIDPEAAKLVNGITKIQESRGALDGWLGKYGKGEVSKFERAQASRDWAEGIRPKEAGYYTKLAPDSQTPGMMEGGLGLPRGRQSVWRGSEEARAIKDARTMAKVSPEEQMAADAAIEESLKRRGLGKRIVDNEPAADLPTASVADAPAAAVDDQVAEALASKVDDIDDDIQQSASALGRHEAAEAEIVEALGPRAAPQAQARATAFREAQRKADNAAIDATAEATAHAEQAAETIALGGLPPKARASGGLGKAAADLGSALEMAKILGIPLPDPSAIPVVGPLLSLYLKARVLGKTFGRFGGKIAETAESTIATKAAQTKQRINTAVDKMLEVGGKVTRAAAGKAGGPAAALGHVLFDDSEPKARRSSYTADVAPKGSIAETFLARSDEVNRAMQPGAIARAVKDRVKTSDPEIVSAIVAAQERKLQFLDSKMPKPNEPTVPTGPRMPWVPSKAEISQWGRYVQAAEDPVSVIEAAANGGHLSIEGVETLRTVYPRLYQEAQQRILVKAQDQKEPLPYARRVQLSVMFEMPFDDSQTAESAQFLQASYQPQPPPQAPTPMQGAPTITADVRMSTRTDPETKSI